MVKVKIYGNAFAHKMAYGRGIHLVSVEIAKRLVDAGVAEMLEVAPPPVETATAPPENMETADKPVDKPRPKPKPRKRKKK